MGQLFNLDSPLMQGLSKAADLILLNIVAVVCSLPVFTLGASAAALYYAVGCMQKDQGHLILAFFQAFKSNFKQATAQWLILLVIGFLLVMAMWFYTQAEISFGGVLLAIVFVLLVLWSMTVSWTFPLQAKFVNTVRGTLQNAVLCALAYFPRSLVMAVLNLIPLALFFLAPYWFFRLGFLWLLIWYALAAFLTLKLLKKPYASLTKTDADAPKETSEE